MFLISLINILWYFSYFIDEEINEQLINQYCKVNANIYYQRLGLQIGAVSGTVALQEEGPEFGS